MFNANIYQNDQVIAQTTVDSDDSFHCLTWAHRMGWDVIEVATGSAKLEKNNGEKAILDFSKA